MIDIETGVKAAGDKFMEYGLPLIIGVFVVTIVMSFLKK
jgi:hypothetical protein